MNVRFIIAWLYYSRFFFSWEEGGGRERTPVLGLLSGLWFCWTDAGKACAVRRRGFVWGWLLSRWNSAKTASKILKLASEDAQTVRIFEATQISASQESAPLLQSPVTGSTRLAGWLFRAVGEGGCSGVGWAISASLDSW